MAAARSIAGRRRLALDKLGKADHRNCDLMSSEPTDEEARLRKLLRIGRKGDRSEDWL